MGCRRKASSPELLFSLEVSLDFIPFFIYLFTPLIQTKVLCRCLKTGGLASERNMLYVYRDCLMLIWRPLVWDEAFKKELTISKYGESS